MPTVFLHIWALHAVAPALAASPIAIDFSGYFGPINSSQAFILNIGKAWYHPPLQDLSLSWPVSVTGGSPPSELQQ